MSNNLIQPKGSVSKETNIQSIARITGVKISEVKYLEDGLDVTGLKYLYDSSTETVWKLNGDETGTVDSWIVQDDVLQLLTSNSTYSLILFDTLNKLKVNDGMKYIGSCTSIDELRTVEPIFKNQKIFVNNYNENILGGGGFFINVTGDYNGDDDSGIYIKTIGGSFWKRLIYKTIVPEFFGCSTELNDNSNKIISLLEYAKNKDILIDGSNNEYKISSNIQIDNANIKNIKITGTGTTNTYVTNSTCDNITFNKVCVRLLGGNMKFTSCNFINCSATAAINGSNLIQDGNLYIECSQFNNNNYGYLRNGTTTTYKINETIILNTRFENHKGDPIELNLTQGDGRVYLEDIYINNVTGTGNSNDFWGIGMGFAGMTGYVIDAAPELYVSNITIVRPYIRNCRQGIHFEKAMNISIIDADIECDSTINNSSGLPPHCIVAYGSVNLNITGGKLNVLNSGNAIGARWGVTGSSYTGPTRDIFISDIKYIKGNIILYSAATDTISSKIKVSNITNMYGSFTYKGYCSDLLLKDIKTFSTDPSVIQINHTSGEGAGVYRRFGFIKSHFENLQFNNMFYGSNGAASSIYSDQVFVMNCNFKIIKESENTGTRGPLLTIGNNDILCPADTPPYNIDFPKGTFLRKSSGSGGWLITSYGSIPPTNDTIRSTTIGQTYIESSNLNWQGASGCKQAGQLIVIPGAGSSGSDLITTITRSPYSSGGFYRLNISDPIETATVAGTTIKPYNIANYIII